LYRKNYTHYTQGLVFDQEAPQDGSPFSGSEPPLLPRILKPFNGGDLFNGAALFAAGNPHFDWWAGAAAHRTQANNTKAGTARPAGCAGSCSTMPPAVCATAAWLRT